MKKILYLFIFLFTLSGGSFAQDDQAGDLAPIRERMIEYIQQKLSLTKSEAERFGPVFIDYFKELRKTNHEYKSDRLVLQQKVAELRLRYRDQFKPIIGDKRSNEVFMHEHEFIQKAKQERDLRLQGRH
jgi:hypothetical protein